MPSPVAILHWLALGCGLALAFRYFRALGDVTQAIFDVTRAELVAAVEGEFQTLGFIAVSVIVALGTHLIFGIGDQRVVLGGLSVTVVLTAFPWLWIHVGLRAQQSNARFYDITQAASTLGADDEVLVLETGDQTWAFPDREIRRPHIAGVGADRRTVMTYCALSRIGMALAIPAGESIELSVAGQHGNNLIMKADGKCLQQIYSGAPDCTLGLRRVPVFRMSWRGYCETYPAGKVYLNPMVAWRNNPLLRLFDEVVERVFDRALDTHHQTERLMFETLNHEDERLPRKTLVWGIAVGDAAAAFTREYTQAQGVVNTVVGGMPVALTFDENVGCLAAFKRPERTHVRHVDFRGHSDAGFLTRIETFYPGMYWFAWANFFPETALNGSVNTSATPALAAP